MSGKRKLVWHNDHKNAWAVIHRAREWAGWLAEQVTGTPRELQGATLDALARAQGVTPLVDVGVLAGTWPGDADDGFDDSVDTLRHGEKEDKEKVKLEWHDQPSSTWAVIPRGSETAFCWQRNYLLRVEHVLKQHMLHVYRLWLGYATDKHSIFEREFYAGDFDDAKHTAISLLNDWATGMAKEVSQWEA